MWGRRRSPAGPELPNGTGLLEPAKSPRLFGSATPGVAQCWAPTPFCRCPGARQRCSASSVWRPRPDPLAVIAVDDHRSARGRRTRFVSWTGSWSRGWQAGPGLVGVTVDPSPLGIRRSSCEAWRPSKMAILQSSPRIPLQRLRDDVIQARSMLADRRHAGASNMSMDQGRGHLLATLESYTAALRQWGLPVPYALRDELRTQRNAYRGCHGGVIRTRIGGGRLP